MKRFKSSKGYGAFEYIIVAALIVLSALIVFNNVKGKGENTLLNRAENSSKSFIDSSISELGVNIEVPSVPGEVIDTSVEMSNDIFTAFLFISKLAGVEIANMNAAQTLYTDFKDNSDPSVISNFMSTTKILDDGKIFISNYALNGIYDFLNLRDFGDGSISVSSPSEIVISSASEILNDTRYYFGDSIYGSNSPYFRFTSHNNTFRLGYNNSDKIGRQHNFVNGAAKIIYSAYYSTSWFIRVDLYSGFSYSSYDYIYFPSTYEHIKSLGLTSSYSLSISDSIPLDSLWWQGKSHTHEGDEGIIIPNMPKSYLEGPELPYQYYKIAPGINYNKNLHSMYFWHSLK